MPSLKDLKNRISSVKSTQKITSAMKMVCCCEIEKSSRSSFSIQTLYFSYG